LQNQIQVVFAEVFDGNQVSGAEGSCFHPAGGV
jgi:hypothetical protein